MLGYLFGFFLLLSFQGHACEGLLKQVLPFENLSNESDFLHPTQKIISKIIDQEKLFNVVIYADTFLGEKKLGEISVSTISSKLFGRSIDIDGEVLGDNVHDYYYFSTLSSGDEIAAIVDSDEKPILTIRGSDFDVHFGGMIQIDFKTQDKDQKKTKTQSLGLSVVRNSDGSHTAKDQHGKKIKTIKIVLAFAFPFKVKEVKELIINPSSD